MTRSTTHEPPAYVRETAQRTVTGPQRILALGVLVAAVVVGVLSPLLLAVVLVASSMVFLLCFIGLKLLLLVGAQRHRYPERLEVPDDALPRYTTLHPLYDEANMIGSVVAAMEAMDYPKDRLQCLLVLESRDAATVQAARDFPLPDYFQIVEVPAIKPYGKPKACNYALQFADGEYAVIYDAEDRPEPDQLRKVVGTFAWAQQRGERLGCLQARLEFENELALRDDDGRVVRDDDGYDVRPVSWTSRFLGNEYLTHFQLVLAGMSHFDLALPLGGTSNHFPVSVLREVAFPTKDMPEFPDGDASVGAWDPWNVTEDAELGGAIAGAGYQTHMVDSRTDEEACLTARATLNQRSRWVKGYLQTTLVLLRRPLANARALGARRYAAFVLHLGGTYLSLMLSPVFWGLFLTYILTGSPRIIALFPGPLYYTGMALLIVGNLSLLSVSLYVAHSRGHHSTLRYLLLLTPLWWLLLSGATYLATIELMFPRWRPSWNKTAHGVRHVSWTRRLAIALGTRSRPTWRTPSVPAVARALTPRLPISISSPQVPGPASATVSLAGTGLLGSLSAEAIPEKPLPPRKPARRARHQPRPSPVVVRPALRYLSAPHPGPVRAVPAAAPVISRSVPAVAAPTARPVRPVRPVRQVEPVRSVGRRRGNPPPTVERPRLRYLPVSPPTASESRPDPAPAVPPDPPVRPRAGRSAPVVKRPTLRYLPELVH